MSVSTLLGQDQELENSATKNTKGFVRAINLIKRHNRKTKKRAVKNRKNNEKQLEKNLEIIQERYENILNEIGYL